MKRAFLFVVFGVSSLFSNKLEIDIPKKITPEWEAKVFGVKYGVTTLNNAVSEMVDGLIDDTFGKDFILRVQKEIEEHPTGQGEYIEYWSNGQIKARLPYKDGRAHGHLHGWYENGKDAFKGYFQEGLKQGIHITFYWTGAIAHNIEARRLVYNKKGQLDGDQSRDHKKGGLWLCIEYDKGVPNGAFEGWDENRKYYIAAQYKRGVLQKNPPPPMSKRPEPKPDPSDKLVDEVIKEFVANSYVKYGIKAYGFGGQMPFDVETISLNFYVYKKGTIEEARELIVRLKKDLAMIVNRKEDLRPYLREYPFSENRAKVVLCFCDKSGNRFNDNKSVAFTHIGKGEIVLYNKRNTEGLYEEIYQEPYKKAVAIVNSKDQITVLK